MMQGRSAMYMDESAEALDDLRRLIVQCCDK
jgi:hypothetical protein